MPTDAALADAPAPPAIARPFIKWAGGKRDLLAQYQPHFPSRDRVRRYFEPFLGGGAVFFHLQIQSALLFDTNPALIEVYQIVRDEVERLIDALQQHENEKTHYYAVRAQDPAQLSAVERAARFIYLNRTGYNGLYRVNRRGQYNVPFGRHKNPVICDRENLRAVSHALQTAQLAADDFEAATDQAGPGDLIYFDPPYAPLSATANFTSYTRNGFSEADQRRLARRVHQLHERGCFVMLSNSSASLIYELYQGYGYHLIEIQARRAINSAPHKRGPVTELLITNFPPASSICACAQGA
jgi:DNA adenine methylase